MTSLANRVLGQGLASLHQRSITEAPADKKCVLCLQSKVEQQFLCYCVVVLSSLTLPSTAQLALAERILLSINSGVSSWLAVYATNTENALFKHKYTTWHLLIDLIV